MSVALNGHSLANSYPRYSSVIAAIMFVALLQRPSHGGDPLLKCGSHCLYIAAKLFEKSPTSFEEVEQIIGPPGASGYSVAELCDGARLFGLEAMPVITSAEHLIERSERFVCIARINTNHFVLLSSVDNGSVSVIDPPLSYTLPLATLHSQWNGAAILISDGPLESEESLTRRVERNRVLIRLAGIAGILVSALVTFMFVKRWRRRNIS